MLKNYLKIALRTLARHKTLAAINIFSLSLGLACCLLILLFVQHELSYDRYHAQADSIYRVYAERTRDSGSVFSFAYLPIPLGPALQESFPEIERFARLVNESVVVARGDKLFSERALFADADALAIFSFPLVQGDGNTALRSPHDLLLSEAMAIKYFGRTQVVGEELRVQIGDEIRSFVIAGVVGKIPENSSIRFDFMFPFDQSNLFASRGTVWSSWNSFLFLEFASEASVADFEAKLALFAGERFTDPPRELYVQRLEDVHLNPAIAGGLVPVSDPMYSYILAGIALLVLTIACINFMTISVGRAASRLKEVGMRKVLGAARLELVKQFWAEAIVLSFLSLLVGIVLASLFLPIFNNFAQKSLSLSAFLAPEMALLLVALMGVVGLIAGSYPALVLSSFKPVDLFKGIFHIGGRGRFNRVLVVLQFALAIILVAGTLVMSRQMAFLQSRNLGFRQEQIVVLENRASDREAMQQRLRDELEQHPEIIGTTGAQFSFTSGSHSVGFQFQEQALVVQEFRVDSHFLPTMGIPLLAGRNFSPDISSDKEQAVIVNEKFVETLGLDDPLTTTITFRGTPNMQIIGVVRDFNFQDLRQPIEPMVMHMNEIARLNAIFVRIAPAQTQQALQTIEKAWRQVAPNLPYEFSFLDENLAQQYEAEQRWSSIVRYSSIFAILVACLGLFGLAALAMHERTKEIGIRKILGASAGRIVALLSINFVLLVLVANLIAWPVAYVAVNKWLQNFAYRIELSWWMFALAGGLALLVALLTVSSQAVKAALANPVDSLRSE